MMIWLHRIVYVFENDFLFQQTYYREYYSRYLDEYEMRQNGVTSGGGEILDQNKDVHICEKEAQDPSKDIEAALLMDDILNNGINFCAIM